ncbi:MAG: DUF2325 domain-containing protein [Gallionellaceae bacterium]|nr:DUF2325 domain-containing protein [Gallionellaceae bacterium]
MSEGGDTVSVTASTLPPAFPPQGGGRQPARRLKLWELEEKFHCPVVGTCFDLDELKKLVRKTGYDGRRFEPYDLHLEAVSLSLDRNPAAELMQKQLERKYALQVRRFDQAKAATEVLALWQEHLERGKVAGAVWAALTHKTATKATRQAVYADLHMLSHQVGAGRAAYLRRLEWLQRELAEAKAQAGRVAARQARERAEAAERIRAVERAAAEATQRAEADSPLRARLAELESGVAMISMGRRLLALADEVGRLRGQAGRADELAADNARLVQERDEARAERDALERLWLDETAKAPACAGDCATCPSRLAGRCVLCVGGRTPLLPQYRQLAERLGVRLIHHDGGREEALSRLPDLLAASDAVICPTDCVGHLAYYQLKKHCKQAGKPCVLVKSSGVASFAAALTRLADSRVEISANAPPRGTSPKGAGCDGVAVPSGAWDGPRGHGGVGEKG